MVDLPIFGESNVSKGAIVIEPERKISDFDNNYWNKIFESIFKISLIYKEFYNEISLEKFNQNYSSLDLDLKSVVCKKKGMYILIFFDENF